MNELYPQTAPQRPTYISISYNK